MSNDEKEIHRYLDGLVVLFHVINNEGDLDKASNVIHDLLLGYEVVTDNAREFDKGYEDVKDIFIDFPREENPTFNRNNYLKQHFEEE